MKKRRLCAAVLTAALVCGLCLPARAASTSSFEDVTSQSTAVNADILRLMGVVTGVGGNKFQPQSNLTRAEFCVMVTNFIQRGDEVSRYAARTIFKDVAGSYWARGYINLMATPVGEGAAMIAGVGDGSFAPDAKVTVAQAVTVLLRVLGYTSKETGFIWPQGYLDFAQSIGLMDNLPKDASAVLTRAQAAQLFVNALNCPTRSETPYYESLGTVAKDVILLAVNVTSDDGSSDSAIRTSLDGEAFLPAVGAVAPVALQGKRGSLILNKQDEIVAFLPDMSNSIAVTLSGNAQPSYLNGTDGKRYTMSSSTLLYTADSSLGKPYIEGYSSLRSGTQVTLFTKSGKVTAIYAAGSTQIEDTAVIVAGKASYATFHQLTGGADNYKILKNGQSISLSEIREYDVATYDRLNNTLIVSDVRLRGIYEDAAPNPKAPLTITALGTEFDVLDSAWDIMDGIKIGDTVTLLLTADGKVAGIASSSKVKDNAIGYATGGGVNVFLSNGKTMEIKGNISSNLRLWDGQPVKLTYGDNRDRLNISVIESNSIPGNFDLNAMTLGNMKVSSSVRVFDQIPYSGGTELELSALENEVILSKHIVAYHADTSGYVDCIILNNVTGNAYRYGFCELDEVTDDLGKKTTTATFQNSISGEAETDVNPVVPIRRSMFCGVTVGLALGNEGESTIIKSHVPLEKLDDLSPADFFENQGRTYLQANGRVYPIADNVSCYKTVNESWFTQETGQERLTACKAFSQELTAYYDPFVGHIRIVAAN